MIGVYDYTVILTYLSLVSAGAGIVASLSDLGHPYWGIFCLLFCGLCDAFDGKVASTKKNRTDLQRKFGIQIDSLSDLVAFGVLPACIGVAFLRRSEVFEKHDFVHAVEKAELQTVLIRTVFFGILIFYILAALIRLAYFNVTEEERQSVETGTRKYYLGLPVTSAAIIFPSVALLTYALSPVDISWMYVIAIVITAILFICPFKLKKLGFKGIMVLVGIGILECLALLVLKILN